MPGMIPKANPVNDNRLKYSIPTTNKDTTIKFSFEALDYNEYFNLDATCSNWASDLFSVLKLVSNIEIKRVHSGEFTGKHSTLRIHNHTDASPPCNIPSNIDLNDLWQIRISKSKGGIHGVFYDNMFYVVWFDPQHNMYPSDIHGGLKKIKPPSTCCKERDMELHNIKSENIKLQELVQTYEDLFNEVAASKS